MEKYLYEIESIPADRIDFFMLLNDKIREAFKRKGKAVRVMHSWYLVVHNNELIEIHKEAELAGSDKWIAREALDNWYSDPMPTKKTLIKSLGL